MAGNPETIRVLRPEDLLVLDVTLTNLAVGDDGHLRVVDPAAPGRVVIVSAAAAPRGGGVPGERDAESPPSARFRCHRCRRPRAGWPSTCRRTGRGCRSPSPACSTGPRSAPCSRPTRCRRAPRPRPAGCDRRNRPPTSRGWSWPTAWSCRRSGSTGGGTARTRSPPAASPSCGTPGWSAPGRCRCGRSTAGEATRSSPPCRRATSPISSPSRATSGTGSSPLVGSSACPPSSGCCGPAG